MRIHCLQHVPFEGPAAIDAWAAARGYGITTTPLFERTPLPAHDDFDCLIVLGGPMGVADEGQYEWMTAEKALLRDVIASGKRVVGVCLGAQMIADALGARVYLNRHKEIGWFPIELTEAGRASIPLGGLPPRLTVFHWHGDTFDLPPGAVHLAASQVCENQAFSYQDHVLGLQFHLESTADSVAKLVANCAAEIVPGDHVQNAERLLAASADDFARLNGALFGVLDRFSRGARRL